MTDARITDEAVEQLAELWHVPTDVRAAGKDLEREISRSTSASLEPAAKQLVSDTIRDSLAFENDMPRGHLLVQIANRAAHLLFERSVLSEAALPHLAPQPLLDREAVWRGIYSAAIEPLNPSGVADKATDAVMEVARSSQGTADAGAQWVRMPTREQIDALLQEWRVGPAFQPPDPDRPSALANYRRKLRNALLVLINGGES